MLSGPGSSLLEDFLFLNVFKNMRRGDRLQKNMQNPLEVVMGQRNFTTGQTANGSFAAVLSPSLFT